MTGPEEGKELARELGVQTDFLRLTEEDLERLRALRPLLEERCGEIVEAFYEHVRCFPPLRMILDGADTEMLRAMLREYILSFGRGSLDQEYYRRRLQIGRSHVEVGLEPRWFLGAFGYFLTALTDEVCRDMARDPSRARQTLVALQKNVFLDVNITLDTYYSMVHRHAMEQEEERHRAIVENATDIIWSFRPGGEITYMNRGLGGFSRDAFLEKGLEVLRSLQTAESQETLDRAVDRIVDSRAGMQNVPMTLIDATSRKKEHYLSNLSPVYSSDGKLARIQVITRDVTEVKKLEQRVLDREQLATVGRMAANVAHEIRNPLAGIKGALETLRPKFEGTERDQAVLKEILDRIDSLNATVQDLLVFSRPLALEKVRMPLRAFLDSVVALILGDPIFSGVAVEFDIPADMELFVDALQGKHAFTNLLLNSAQAMEGMGRIDISAHVREGTVEIVFEDYGPGVEEEHRDHIFNPFFTTKSHGTGLGLSIVRWIVQAHGGSISLDPSFESGARFVVVLPLE